MTNSEYFESKRAEQVKKAFEAFCGRFKGGNCDGCPLNNRFAGPIDCFAKWVNMEHNAEDDVKKQVTVDDVKKWLEDKCEMLENAIWSANLSDSTDDMKAKLEVLEEMRLEFGFKERKERK